MATPDVERRRLEEQTRAGNERMYWCGVWVGTIATITAIRSGRWMRRQLRCSR